MGAIKSTIGDSGQNDAISRHAGHKSQVGHKFPDGIDDRRLMTTGPCLPTLESTHRCANLLDEYHFAMQSMQKELDNNVKGSKGDD